MVKEKSAKKNKSGMEIVDIEADDVSVPENIHTLWDFLSGKQPNCAFKRGNKTIPFVADGTSDGFFELQQLAAGLTGIKYVQDSDELSHDLADSEGFDAFLVVQKSGSKTSQFFLIDGDLEDDNGNTKDKAVDIDELQLIEMPPNTKSATISLQCLEQMFDLYYAKILSKLTFLDASSDTRIPLTKQEEKAFDKFDNSDNPAAKPPKPPEFGFTRVGRNWHRAGWVCFCDDKHNFYIVGQDEGSYFCSQLPVQPKTRKNMTIAEALRMLIPAEATVDTPRQGEWFLVEVDDSEVPKTTESIMFSDDSRNDDSCGFTLPIDDPEANHHKYSGDFRVDKNGQLFVTSGELTHDQHGDLHVPSGTWHKFIRNTARKSVSVQGVD